MLHTAHGLCTGHMRQCRPMHHVADCIISRHIGLIPVIYYYLATLHSNAGLFQSQILKIGHHAYGTQHHVAVHNRLCVAFHIFYGHMTNIAFNIYLLNTGTGHNFHSHLAETTAHLRCCVFILVGQYLGHKFNERHLYADTLIEESKLAANSSAAAHNHTLRLEGQGHGLTVSNNALAILRHAWHHTATRTCGNNYMLGFILCHGTVGSRHGNLVPRLHTATAHYHFYIIFLQQKLHTLAHRLCHASRTLHHG